MAQVNLLTVEDATIRAMMSDPRLLQLLPCLSGPKQQIEGIKAGGKDCARCQAEKKQIAADAMRNAKMCVVGTRGQKLNEVKTLLNARQLRIYVKNTAGKKTAYTL